MAEGQVLLTWAGVWLICDLADSILIGVFDYYDVDVGSQGRSGASRTGGDGSPA